MTDKKPEDMPIALEARSISKLFGAQRALDNISFSLARERIMSIIGPSGSGKTTLLRIMCQLERADSGEALVEGLKIGESKRQDALIMSKIGIVFQSFNLFPHLTVLKNITLAYKFHHRDRSEQEARGIGMDLLRRVNLSDKADKYPCMLSGGESQRVAIARSLALKPDILFFDEPTSALDLETVKGLSALIRRIRDEESNTLVIVTHDMNFAKAISDEVLFLEKGEMVFFGSAREAFGDASGGVSGDALASHPGNERIRSFLANGNLDSSCRNHDDGAERGSAEGFSGSGEEGGV